MSKIIDPNLLNIETNKIYPTHGWLYTQQKVKLLYFPILDVISNIEQIRTLNGLKKIKDGWRNEIVPLCNTLRKLVVALEEIHKFNRLISEMPIELEKLTQEQTNEKRKYLSLVSIFADVSIIYFRRIADLLVTILGSIIIEDYEKAPKKFRDWYKKINNGEIKHYKTSVDSILLQEIFKKENLVWFNKLSNVEKREKRGRDAIGIRENLEHCQSYINTSIQKIGDKPSQISLKIFSNNKVFSINGKVVDLINEFKEISNNFCQFLNKMCELIDYSGKYGSNNYLMIADGFDDEDIVGFWPEIK